MQLVFVVETPGDTAAELRSLRDWLRGDDDVKGMADLAPTAPKAGEMGAVSDALTLLTQPGEAAAIASVLTVWLRNRKSNVTARVRHGDREVEISATNVDDAEQLVRLVMQEEG